MHIQKTPTGSSLLYYFAIGFLLCACGLVSCKEQDINYFEEETLTQAISVGMMEAYDALQIDYLTEVSLMRHPTKLDTGCAEFTLNPQSLSIQFDTCAQPFFNRLRMGAINIAFQSHIGDTLAPRTITFKDYYVSGRKIEGQIELQNITVNHADSSLNGVCRFTNFKVTFPEGTSVIYNGSQNRLWNFGFGDSNPNNNTYLLTAGLDSLKGTASGYTGSAYPFTTNIKIEKPVSLIYTCDKVNAVAGIVEVTNLGGYPAMIENPPKNTREVDFGGSQQCDGAITVITWRRAYAVLLD